MWDAIDLKGTKSYVSEATEMIMMYMHELRLNNKFGDTWYILLRQWLKMLFELGAEIPIRMKHN